MSDDATSPAAPAPQPTPYHRLATLRPEWGRWWRPLTTFFAIAIIWLILASLLMVGTVLVLTALGADRSIGQALDDPTSPLDVFVRCALGDLLLPAGLLGVRLGGWRTPSLLWSVEGRWRPGLLRRALVTAVLAVTAIMVVMGILLGDSALSLPSAGRTIGVIAVLLLVAPLQAAGEELVLRGAVMQGVGTWVRSPVLPVIATMPLATIGHTGSLRDLVGAAAISLSLGALVWRTGGLEAAIVVRAVLLVEVGLLSLFGAGEEVWRLDLVAVILASSLLLSLRSDDAVRADAASADAATADGDSRNRGPFVPVMRPADAPVPPSVRV